MPGTYAQILFHIVFSTKCRRALITPEIQPRLYAYIGGIVRSEKGTLHAIGGMPDHVHMLLRWRTDDALANLMGTAKARSSLWVHQTYPESATFAWQEGYAVFSVSKSIEPGVKEYIAHQAEHHRKNDFKDELLALLNAHGVEFDARYVFA